MMVMEALEGFDAKFEYALVGHSGDGPTIPFVPFGAPPPDRKARLAVLEKMVAHSQFCWSGDHTVEAAAAAVAAVKERCAGDGGGGGDDDDDNGGGGGGGDGKNFVFLLSDANLRRYRINPKDLGDALQGKTTSTKQKGTRGSGGGGGGGGGSSASVSAHLVMIASAGDEAAKVVSAMAPGTASVCLDAHDLPNLIKAILAASIDAH